MPDNPAGVYSLPPSYKVANGDLTDASQHNPPFEDVQQALTNRVCKDGRTAWTGNHNANGNRLTGLADGVSPQDAATKAQLDDMGTAIGDGKWSARDLGENWLRRNGDIYDIEDYPDLGALLGALPAGVTWNNASTPSEVIRAVAFGNGTYMAVGNNGYLATSPDLSTWTVRPTGITHDLHGVAYGNGKFVAVGYDGSEGVSIVADEEDLDDWTAVTHAVQLLGVAFGATFFVAIGSSQAIRASTDAVTWSTRTGSITAGSLRGIAFDGTLFIIAGDGGTDRQLQTSSNTTSWSLVAVTTSASTFYNIDFVNSTYVISGNNGILSFSANLSSWTDRTVGASTMRAVAYGDGFWAAVGTDGAYWSDDQINWDVDTDYPGYDVIFDGTDYFVSTGLSSGRVSRGQVAASTQFQVPTSSDPTRDWIRAL